MHSKFIITRILSALDINWADETEIIDWKKFNLFKSILYTIDASNDVMVGFMIRVSGVIDRNVKYSIEERIII